MGVEISAGGIVFYRSESIEYLLLLSTFWGFPKGHIELGEDERTAARREIREEAGLEVSLLDDFRKVDDYWFQRHGERIHKQAIYYLAEAETRDSHISWEHCDMAWLPFDSALAHLQYEGGRTLLRKANDFLLKHLK